MKEDTKDFGDSQIYEIGYHLLPTVAEENIPSEVSKIHSVISEMGGSIISEGAPQVRQLAYDIAKKIDNKNLNFNKAYFGWIKFEMEKSIVSGFVSKLESFPEVLRFLVVKTVKENTMHSPKMPIFKKEGSREAEADSQEKTPVSEEEIDKSIDELVTS